MLLTPRLVGRLGSSASASAFSLLFVRSTTRTRAARAIASHFGVAPASLLSSPSTAWSPVVGLRALSILVGAGPPSTTRSRTSTVAPSTPHGTALLTIRGYAKKESKRSKAASGSNGATSDVKPSLLDECIRDLENTFGKGAVTKLGGGSAPNPLRPHEVISTGSIGLDVALGVGGLPRGRIAEIYGPESSGKTTLALHVIAQAQKIGGLAAFIDAEHALDPHYASRIGVKTEELLVSQPDCGEQALEIADALIRSNRLDVIVIDSVAALVPKAELDGEMGDHHIGLQARLMSQAMRKLTASLARSKTLLIFINQIRIKVGVMFGSPEVTSGGNALKFYSSVRLDVRKVAQLKKGDDHVGTQVRVTVKKNKMAAPFREAQFDIDFGSGISRVGELVDLGLSANVIEKAGAWYSYGDKQLGQGRDKAKTLLTEDTALAAEIEAKVRDTLMSKHRLVADHDTDTDTDDASSDPDAVIVEEEGDATTATANDSATR